jgi:hypothetical protein
LNLPTDGEGGVVGVADASTLICAEAREFTLASSTLIYSFVFVAGGDTRTPLLRLNPGRPPQPVRGGPAAGASRRPIDQAVRS